MSDPDSDFIMYSAEIQYNNLVTQTEGGVVINCTINRCGVEDGLNEDVDEAKNRVIATEAMARAEELGNRNDFEGARNLLTVAHGEIQKSASKASPFCQNLSRDLTTAQSRMTDRVTWNRSGKNYVSQNLACHRMERAVNFKSMEYASQNIYNTKSKARTLDHFEDEDSDDSDCGDFAYQNYSNRNYNTPFANNLMTPQLTQQRQQAPQTVNFRFSQIDDDSDDEEYDSDLE